MFDVKNAKQINVIWTDNNKTTVIPCKNWTAEQKKRTLAQYARYTEASQFISVKSKKSLFLFPEKL